MIAIVHSIYSQSVHAPARDAGLMDNDDERYWEKERKQCHPSRYFLISFLCTEHRSTILHDYHNK